MRTVRLTPFVLALSVAASGLAYAQPATSPIPIHPTGVFQGTNGAIYGTSGINSDDPLFFKLTGLMPVHDFAADPRPPSTNPPQVKQVIQGTDGEFYISLDGLHDSFGHYGVGIVKMTASGDLTTVYAWYYSVTAYGAPANLLQATDGNLYFTQSVSFGVEDLYDSDIVRLSPTGQGGPSVVASISIGVFFPYVGDFVALVQGSDGALYGLRSDGTLFRVGLDGTNSTDLYKVGVGVTLLAGSDGNVYGTTSSSIFRATPAGNVTILHTFNPSAGDPPFKWFAQAPDGTFFGSDGNRLVQVTADGTESIVHTFTDHEVVTSLAAGPSGVYGTFSSSDSLPGGAIFSYAFGTYTIVHAFPPSAAADDVPLVGDIDGDGKADLVVWRRSTGTWFWLTSSSGYDYAQSRAQQWGSASLGDVPLLADLDGDGKADLVVWRASTGTWYWLKSSSNFTSSDNRAWGNQTLGDVPLTGDVDGDGRADLVIWRASTGTWFCLTSSTGFTPGAARIIQWGNDGFGDAPLLGDLDGDHKADPIVWRASTGAWLWLKSSLGLTGGDSREWGNQSLGDVPLLADMDGDGIADPVVWRAGTGTWWWLKSSSDFASGDVHQWGNQILGDTPFVADMDGDGKADLIVWRASTGTWYWLTSSSGYSYGSARAVQWGKPAY